jgi:hypothetical protein
MPSGCARLHASPGDLPCVESQSEERMPPMIWTQPQAKSYYDDFAGRIVLAWP